MANYWRAEVASQPLKRASSRIMYRIEASKKRDPRLRWGLPDRVFFACGACHILAYAFLERYRPSAFRALWLRPAPGFSGNHILITAGGWVFDYHGYSDRHRFLAHTFCKAQRWWPGWDATLIELPRDVLISEPKSRAYDGLWLREPKQFLHDPLPRAHAYLNRFPAPPTCE
jgi:hypothetical protein